MSTVTEENLRIFIEESNKPLFDEPGDHDKYAHYVDKNKLMEAMLEGKPLLALCGKFWVPTRDGLKFPVCPECKEKWESLDED